VRAILEAGLLLALGEQRQDLLAGLRAARLGRDDDVGEGAARGVRIAEIARRIDAEIRRRDHRLVERDAGAAGDIDVGARRDAEGAGAVRLPVRVTARIALVAHHLLGTGGDPPPPYIHGGVKVGPGGPGVRAHGPGALDVAADATRSAA